jgi:hypothetical protein
VKESNMGKWKKEAIEACSYSSLADAKAKPYVEDENVH